MVETECAEAWRNRDMQQHDRHRRVQRTPAGDHRNGAALRPGTLIAPGASCAQRKAGACAYAVGAGRTERPADRIGADRSAHRDDAASRRRMPVNT
ncbi:MAG: hypothetical protein ACK5TI_00425 [bacterium]